MTPGVLLQWTLVISILLFCVLAAYIAIVEAIRQTRKAEREHSLYSGCVHLNQRTFRALGDSAYLKCLDCGAVLEDENL